MSFFSDKLESAFNDSNIPQIMAQTIQTVQQQQYDAQVTAVGNGLLDSNANTIGSIYANGQTNTGYSGFRQMRPGDIGTVVGSRVF